MIITRKPLAITEVKEYIKDLDEKKDLADYFKKFTILSPDKAVKLSNEIRALNNPKIKEENIVKIVDFLPRDSEDLNKIFIEVSLSEEESNVILEIIRKY